MPSYKTPGVYVEEESLNPPHMTAVESSVPVFIGYTLIHKDEHGKDLKNKPFKIHSFNEYIERFGTDNVQSVQIVLTQKIVAATGQAQNASVELLNTNASHPDHLLYYSIQLYFANGGGPCYIFSVGQQPQTLNPDVFINAINALESHDESTLIVFPDVCKYPHEKIGDIIDVALFHCEMVMNRMVIIDVPDAYPGGNETHQAIDLNFREKIISDTKYLKNGAAYFPYLKATIPPLSDDNHIKIERHIVISVNADGTEEALTGPFEGLYLSDDQIKVNDTGSYNLVTSFVQNNGIILPPSGAVAGAYVRNDLDQGVWKAPANISLSNVQEPAISISDQFQEKLNVDPVSGKSINAIRQFTGKGTLIWGARTLAGNDNEWRYVPVRRFFDMVEESINKAMEQFVYEPNDSTTWSKIKSMIENFLLDYWKKGALSGAKPEEAFFVKVGLGETMTEDDILNRRLIVEIGMAVVRPAEFVIFRISKKLISKQVTIFQRKVNFLRQIYYKIFKKH